MIVSFSFGVWSFDLDLEREIKKLFYYHLVVKCKIKSNNA